MIRARTGGADAGESLIEILIALVIVGIAFAAILAGVGTAVSTSSVNRAQADDTAYSRALAERIQAMPYSACNPLATYEADLASVDVPSGSSRSLEVTYWDGSAYSTTCSNATALQKVVVTTTPADGRAAGTPLEVLKRKP